MAEPQISDDLKAAVAKHLPNMVAGEMQEFIKQAEDRAAKLVHTERMLAEANARINTLTSTSA